MGKKILIYIAGIITGVILTFGVLAIIAANNNQDEDDIAYFETPINPFDRNANRQGKVEHVLDRLKAFFAKYFGFANGKFDD